MNRYKFDSKNHIHLLDGKPLIGTSHIGDVIAKPLTWWASGKALEAFGWVNPKKVKKEEIRQSAQCAFDRIMGGSLDDYLELLDTSYRAHDTKKKEAATEGTDLHKILEDFIASGVVKDIRIQPFVDWFNENVDKVIASEKHCYSERLWVGGITDLVVRLKNGQIGILDFKSSKEAYFSQFIQVSGYAIQVEENGIYDENGVSNADKIEIDFVGIVPFGGDCKPILEYNLSEFKKSFEAALQIYKHKAQFEQK